MAKHVHTIGGGCPPPFDLIDMATHPDGPVLRLCCTLVKMWDARDRLESAIASTESAIRSTNPVTADGMTMKRLAVGGVA